MSVADDFVDSLIKAGYYADTTIFYYRHNCQYVLNLMESLGIEPDPEHLTDEDLLRLVKSIRDKSPATMKNYLVPLKSMCEFKHNYVFNMVKIVYPADTRPNVDWLTFDECKEVLSTYMTPIQEMIVTLELLHGLRRIEVTRLTLSDLHDDYMTIRGKGRATGKLRNVPYHPDFQKSFTRWMKVRNDMKWKTIDPTRQVDNVIVYLKGKRLRPYDQIKGSGITQQINDLSNRCGIHFSNHTLRRTFGRELFRSGVPVEVIATIYGHTSTSVTMKYLGLNMDDMTDAMTKMKLRF